MKGGALVALAWASTVLGEQHGPSELMPGFKLSWSMDATFLQVDITAQTAGWLGFGIASNGGMKGADMMVGWVDDATGAAMVEDRWSQDFVTPVLDTSQDWELVLGEQTCNATCSTRIVARRLKVTGDTETDWPVRDGFNRVVIATGPTDYFMYHGPETRLAMPLDLSGSAPVDPLADLKADPNIKTLDLVNGGLRIPTQCYGDEDDVRSELGLNETSDRFYVYAYCADQVTTYVKVCHDNILPNTAHIVAFEPIIDATLGADPEPSTVHHFVVDGSGDGDACGGAYNVIWTWAPGINATKMPSEAGFLAGPGGYNGIAIETHFDNPAALDGVVDNSGIRIYYTETLRQYDAGVLSLGDPEVQLADRGSAKSAAEAAYEATHVSSSLEEAHESAISDEYLPAGLSKFNFECSSESTSELLSAPITVFGRIHHAHAHGIKMRSRQYSKSIERGAIPALDDYPLLGWYLNPLRKWLRDSGLGDRFYLLRDTVSEFYDFNYQGELIADTAMFGASPFTISPGDSFLIECWYKTPNDQVKWGLASDDEMCIDFVYYYPREHTPGSEAYSSPVCGGITEGLGYSWSTARPWQTEHAFTNRTTGIDDGEPAGAVDTSYMEALALWLLPAAVRSAIGNVLIGSE